MIEIIDSVGTITISQEKYDILVDSKARLDIAVEHLCNGYYCGIESILTTLGTERALQKADEIRRKKDAARKIFKKPQGGGFAMNENEKCENCAFCIPMPIGEFTCDNENSAAYGKSVKLDDYCEGFEDIQEVE